LAVLAALAVATTVVVPQRARADANAEARVFFEEGSRHLAAALRLRGARRTRELEQALAAYVSSIRIVRSRNAVYNAGVALEELARVDEAYGYFAEYVGMEGVSDDDRTEAQRRMDAIRPRVAVVAASSAPPGAEVRVDRRDLATRGVTPIELALPAGEHTLWFSRAGYETAERRVTAVVGVPQRVEVELAAVPVVLRVLARDRTRALLDGRAIETNTDVRVPPGRHVVRLERPDGSSDERAITLEPGSAPAEIDAGSSAVVAARAHVSIESNVRARVLANGRPLGTGTRVGGDVDAGHVLVHVEADGFAPYETTLTARAGQTTRVRARLERSHAGETRLGSWPLLTGILSAAAGGVAIALSVRAGIFDADWEDALEANRNMPNLETAVAAEAAANRLDDANRLADIFWITTAALGTTTLVLALVNGDVEQPPSTGTIAVAPVTGGAMLVAELPWRAQ